MVMVEEATVPTLSVEGKLIIFPAYTFYLQKNGYTIIQRNDKASNRKLNEYLMNANIAEAIGQEPKLPDIAIYDEGKWKGKNLTVSQYVIIDAGKYGHYKYYRALLDDKYASESVKNAIQAFVMQYSSAKLQVVKK